MKTLHIYFIACIYKSRNIVLLIFLFFTFAIVGISCNQKDDDKVTIAQIDMKEMAKLHLINFNLLRESISESETEYVFRRSSDSSIVFITIRICLSSIDAENSITKYFSEIAMKMHEGPYQNIAIGDRYWWLTPDSTLIVRDLLFKRENVYFKMSSSNFPSLIELAKDIDGDILLPASYVKFNQ